MQEATVDVGPFRDPTALSKEDDMKRTVYVRNETDIALWASMAIDDERITLVFMTWEEMPEHKRKEEDRLDAWMIHDFEIAVPLPVDPLTGETAIKLYFSEGLDLAASIDPKGMNGGPLIALIRSP